MGKINTDNYPNRPFASYQDDDMFILQDNGGETYTTNVGDIKNLADSRIKLEGVKVNGSDLPISGKKVNVDISGKTDLSVIAYSFNSEMGYFKGAYVTYNGKLYEFIQEHTGAWNPSHVREIKATGRYVRAGNGGYNNGDRATCEGYMTKASGNYSHAEGRETQAVGECTHAEGRETIANSAYQHVEGKYNIVDADNKYAHIVGNGTADNARSNALTLDWNGNLRVSGDIADSNGDVTVEGNPVTFDSPFEQDAKSVVVSVKPIQNLHGYDHPWVGGAGKNKLPLTVDGIKAANSGETWSGNSCVINGVTFTILTDSDGNVTGIHAEGTANNNILYFRLITNLTIDTPMIFSSGYTYTWEVNGRVMEVSDGNTTYKPSVVSGIEVPVGTYEVHIAIAVGTTVDDDYLPMIRLATESDATFAPYSNECPISGIDEVKIEVSDGESEPTTTTLPLPSTLYGGEVDVTNGSGNGTKDKIVLDGSDDEGWRQSTSVLSPDRRVFYPFDFPNSKPAGDDGNTNLVSMSSNMYDIGTTSYYDIVQMTSFAIGIGGTSSGATIGVNVDGAVIDTLADFKAWLVQNPLEVAYELATPDTISLTPATIELLEGTNVVTTNGEKVAVTYGRSLWQDIDALKSDTEGKLDKSDVADVEGDTASKAYSVNDFMLRADGFYVVTQPIAQNASITASNTTKTTIGAVLTALLNA